MVWTLSIVIILLFLLPIYYREARIYDAHGAYKHTSHVVVSLNSVTLNLKRTHIRTYPGSLSFFLLRHQSSTFFFFIWYFLYTTTGINIDPRCPLHAAYCMPSYIYLVCIIYARVFIIIIVYDSLGGPPIILLSISCTAHARNNKLLLYIPQERVKHKSADYNRHSSLHSSYARKIVHDCIMII
ncbi:Uncharacterized protein FWK35_00012717 [Aphis craccivora]|uniref:Uncharacterized protein n=1 Tax=Aphis craccivora TaxID=307492 RepID=A0A6G0ZDN0_APHCR|nr:Uncharacterized protein FWK35_00012717 [Aphis craccivora]